MVLLTTKFFESIRGSITILKRNILSFFLVIIKKFRSLLLNKSHLVITTIKSFIDLQLNRLLYAIARTKSLMPEPIVNTPYVLDKGLLGVMFILLWSFLIIPIYILNLWIYDIECPDNIKFLMCSGFSTIFIYTITCILYNYCYNKANIYNSFLNLMKRMFSFIRSSTVNKLLVIFGLILFLIISMMIISQLRNFSFYQWGISQPNLLQTIYTFMIVGVSITYILNIFKSIFLKKGSIGKRDFSIFSPDMVRSVNVFRIALLLSSVTLFFYYQPLNKIFFYLGILDNKPYLYFNYLYKVFNLENLFLNKLNLNGMSKHISRLYDLNIPCFSYPITRGKLVHTCSEVPFNAITDTWKNIRSSLYSFFIDNFYNKPCKASQAHYLNMVSYKSCLLVNFNYNTTMFKPICDLTTTNCLDMKRSYVIYLLGEYYNTRILQTTYDLNTTNNLDMKTSTIVYWPSKHQYIEALVQKFLETVTIPSELVPNNNSQYIKEPTLLVSSYGNDLDKQVRLHALSSNNPIVYMMLSRILNINYQGLDTMEVVLRKLAPALRYNSHIENDGDKINMYSDFLKIDLGLGISSTEINLTEEFLLKYYSHMFKLHQDGYLYYEEKGRKLIPEDIESIVRGHPDNIPTALRPDEFGRLPPVIPEAIVRPPVDFDGIILMGNNGDDICPSYNLLYQGNGSDYFKGLATWLKYLWIEKTNGNLYNNIGYASVGVASGIGFKRNMEALLLTRIVNEINEVPNVIGSRRISRSTIFTIYNHIRTPEDILLSNSYLAITPKYNAPSTNLLITDPSKYYEEVAGYLKHLSSQIPEARKNQELSFVNVTSRDYALLQNLTPVFPNKEIKLMKVTLERIIEIHNYKVNQG